MVRRRQKGRRLRTRRGTLPEGSFGGRDGGAVEEHRKHVNGVLVEAAIVVVEEDKLLELPLKNGGVAWP